jgi:hypothetical protein
MQEILPILAHKCSFVFRQMEKANGDQVSINTEQIEQSGVHSLNKLIVYHNEYRAIDADSVLAFEVSLWSIHLQS